MISHKHKCIFIHIPKVAGQSIELFFLNLNGLDWSTREKLLLKPNKNPDKGPPRLAHLKSYEYASHDYLSQKDFDSYFKFSFVRNPWDRVVSLYKFTRLNNCITFKRFVKKILPRLIKKEEWFYGSQYNYIYLDNKQLVDFVGRFENLQEDFSKVCSQLHIDFEKLPHKNKSLKRKGFKKTKQQIKFFLNHPNQIAHFKSDTINSPNFKDYYTKELIDLVYDLYRKDVDTFGYNFDD